MSNPESLPNNGTLGWGKHAEATRWCSILAIKSGSVLTRCRGRFAQCDDHEITDRPPVEVRCVACQQAFAAHELDQLAVGGDQGHGSPVAASKPYVTAHDAISARKGYIDSVDYVPGEDW